MKGSKKGTRLRMREVTANPLSGVSRGGTHPPGEAGVDHGVWVCGEPAGHPGCDHVLEDIDEGPGHDVFSDGVG
jgi:hypothetical protein